MLGILLFELVFTFGVFTVFSDIDLYRHRYDVLGLCSEFLTDSTAAVMEELLFRVSRIGFLLYLFQKLSFRWTIAIIVSTLYWSYLHGDMNNRLGIIKAVQVFPIGIGCAYLFKRYGLESALITHILFNLTSLLAFSIYLSRAA